MPVPPGRPPAGRGRCQWSWRRRALAGVSVGIAVGVLAVAVRPQGREATLTLRDVEVDGRYVANPGMGWQDTDLADPRLPQSVEYVRPTQGWAGLNPGPGVYDWSAIDDALDAAAARGHMASLRIYTMRHPRSDGHKLPRWVLDAGAAVIDGEPDYGNAVYQDRWATFVNALRRRYDGDPRLAFIDISGYGNYNEWSWQDQTEWDADWRAPETVDGQARRRLADMFLGGSGTVRARDRDGHLTRVTYRYPGFRHTQLVMPYAGIRQSLWYALDRRPDVGWRFDCLGQISADDLRALGDDALQRWRQAPMVFEFCSEVDWERVDEAVALTHPTLVHDNATTGRRELADLLATVGYRYALDSARWPRSTAPGVTMPVRMWWRNGGTTIAYERMGVRLRLRVALLATGDHAADTMPVRTWTVSDDVDGWAPGTPSVVDAELPVPADLPAGRYTIAAAIVDDATHRPIALPLRGVTDDGWLPLGPIRIERPT